MKISREHFGLFVAAMIYGAWVIMVREVQVLGFFLPNAMRAVFIVLILFPIVIIKKVLTIPSFADIGIILLRSFSGISGMLLTFYAFSHASTAQSYFPFYTTMIFGGFFFGALLFHDKIIPEKYFAALVSFIGLVIIYWGNLYSNAFLPMMLSSLGGLGIAGWNIFSKYVSGKYNTFTLVLYDNIVFAFVLSVLWIMSKEPFLVNGMAWPWIVNLVFAFLLIATDALVVFSFRKLSPAVGNVILLFEIPIGLFFGYVFYGDGVTLIMIPGGILILGGILFMTLIDNKEERSQS